MPAPSPCTGLLSPLRIPGCCVAVVQPVLRKQVGSFHSLEHSSESRRCRNGLISGSALSRLLGVLLKLLLPEALRCDGAVDSRPSNPRHAAFEGGGIAEEKKWAGRSPVWRKWQRKDVLRSAPALWGPVGAVVCSCRGLLAGQVCHRSCAAWKE